jgi:hypothetical protein
MSLPGFVRRVKASVSTRTAAAACICVTVAVLLLTLLLPASTDMLETALDVGNSKRCAWTEDMPVIYHLNTYSGVGYDGGHWFHVAENFMAQHSKLRSLRAEQPGQSSPRVFFHVDRANFIDEMNPVTRLFISLGLSTGTLEHGHFIYTHSNAKFGSKGNTFLFNPASITHAWSFDSTQNAREKFSKPVKNNFHNDGKPMCVKYMGAVGGEWPTPQRGHWFPNSGDVADFHRKIERLCPFDPELHKKYEVSTKYKLVAYQRDLTRKIDNLDEALKSLKSQLSADWTIHVLMHDSARSPCELMHALRDTDVLLTSHGFQSMLILFMPSPSLLFEVYPYRYYKRGYGPLGKEIGVTHRGILSPPKSFDRKVILPLLTTKKCMELKQCRTYAR